MLVTPRDAVGIRGHARDGAAIGALLRTLPPSSVIFAPGRWLAVLVGLQTADHIRPGSPVQAAQGTPAPGDRTRIERCPVGEQGDALALRFAHRRPRIFSALLSHPLVSISGRWLPHGRTSEVCFR
jgi:hypothetical protein